jgi:hypothetical protein
MEQTLFNTTVFSAIGSVRGTYRPAMYPEGILPYLCWEVSFCCMSVTMSKIQCGVGKQCDGERFAVKKTLLPFSTLVF